MSLPWIKVFPRIRRHIKTERLAEILGRRRGVHHYIVDLWLWAGEECPAGNLSAVPDKIVARNAGWTGDAARFVAALRDVGFVDADGMLHGWEEHQPAHVALAVDPPAAEDVAAAKRIAAAVRQQSKRDRDAARDMSQAERDSGVTERDGGVTRVTERDVACDEAFGICPEGAVNAEKVTLPKIEIETKIESEKIKSLVAAAATTGGLPASNVTPSPRPPAALGSPGDDLGKSGRPATPAPASPQAPLALVGAPVAKPARKATAKAPEEPTAKADRLTWLGRYAAHTGISQASVADLESPGFCIRFAVARKARGLDVLLRALDGTQAAKDPFWHGKSPLALLGDAAIDAGLAAVMTGGRSIAAPGATPPPPKATVLPPLPNMTAAATAALEACRPAWASREPKPAPPTQAEIEARIATRRAQIASTP